MSNKRSKAQHVPHEMNKIRDLLLTAAKSLDAASSLYTIQAHKTELGICLPAKERDDFIEILKVHKTLILDVKKFSANIEKNLTTCEVSTLTQLPNELWRLVFRQLGKRQLFRVRAVCRAWRDLALHPFVWSHRTVNSRRLGLLRSVLSLAPCVEDLELRSDFIPCLPTGNESQVAGFDSKLKTESDPVAEQNDLALSSFCAAEKLDLSITDFARAAQIIQRQIVLGRLKEVALDFESACTEADLLRGFEDGGFADLLKELTCGNIEKLSIYSDFGGLVQSALLLEKAQAVYSCIRGSQTEASLKYLHCSSNELTTLSEFLLETYAATLQEMDLNSDIRLRSPVFASSPLFPNLRRISCSLPDDMSLLLQCPHLESVDLYMDVQGTEDKSEPLAAAALFFRQATGLKSLRLDTGYSKCVPSVRKLVSALGESHLSPLECLTICVYPGSGVQELANRLASALHHLPNLRKLEVKRVPTKKLLMALACGAAPRLNQMEFVPKIDGGVCLHAWSHQCEVQGALRENKSLHLKVDRRSRLVCEEDQAAACSACRAGCHPQFNAIHQQRSREQLERVVLLYSHEESEAKTCKFREDTSKRVVRIDTSILKPCKEKNCLPCRHASRKKKA